MYATGKFCASTPSVCKECCDDFDCPDQPSGQKCVAGKCAINGCSAFQCWNAQGRQVCKIAKPPNSGGPQCVVSVLEEGGPAQLV